MLTIVTYTDRDYRTVKRRFRDYPLTNPPRDGLVQAKKYIEKLNDKDAADPHGFLRTTPRISFENIDS